MSKPSLSQVVKSVLSAAVGVQSDKNREQDFKSGSIGIYLVVGGIATILFICLVVFVVSLVL